jgi:hypothetical protein
MRKTLVSLFLLWSLNSWPQTDSTKWVRAFPITNYIKDVNDSVKLVQLYLPDGPVIAQKQLGLLRGVYKYTQSDTLLLGTGSCVLNKGQYYYFTIALSKGARTPRENDLVYTVVRKPATYTGQLIRLASHFIGLQDVYEKDFFDRYAIFRKWEWVNEELVLDSMVRDIQFTGNYFLKNNPAMNVKITGGKYDGKLVLNIMAVCSRLDLANFLDYVIARPRLYAGRQWKIAEVFATWLSAGSPTVVRKPGDSF